MVLCGTRNGALKNHFKVLWDTFIGFLKDSFRKCFFFLKKPGLKGSSWNQKWFFSGITLKNHFWFQMAASFICVHFLCLAHFRHQCGQVVQILLIRLLLNDDPGRYRQNITVQNKANKNISQNVESLLWTSGLIWSRLVYLVNVSEGRVLRRTVQVHPAWSEGGVEACRQTDGSRLP